jgi:hypothetical protein
MDYIINIIQISIDRVDQYEIQTATYFLSFFIYIKKEPIKVRIFSIDHVGLKLNNL